MTTTKSESAKSVRTDGQSLEREILERAVMCGLQKQVAITESSSGSQRQTNLRRLLELTIEATGLSGVSADLLLTYEPGFQEKIPGGLLCVGNRRGGHPHLKWADLRQLAQANDMTKINMIVNWTVSVSGMIEAEMDEAGVEFNAKSVFDYLTAGGKEN